MSPWINLLLAGVLEVVFTSMMKLSHGLSLQKWPYLIGFLIAGACSFYFLSRAMQGIPIGTAYAVWTGIGAAGTAVVGIVFFKDPVSFGRVFFLGLLVVSVVGLKFVSPEP